MIYIGSDHAGFDLKAKLLAMYGNFADLGTYSSESCDYPIIAQKLCSEVLKAPAENLGILICGSGTGMAIAANKIAGIRAANCWNREIARLAKSHNNANVLCLAARFLDFNEVVEIIESFINTPFSGEERHLKRLKLL